MSDGNFPVYFLNKIQNPISAKNKRISCLSECYRLRARLHETRSELKPV